uniref:alpha/beta fold hydrolase n=1 Tax=Dielma fastidiosa TaxID=1034346 RepID=UPI000EC0E50F|nr:alpha/beta hydrolase [Dielma fastidiosa]HAH92479.1 alpha/beta hydrolase [Dielma fastidiosa]
METIIYVNQCRLYLEIEGEGEPLLFLHGNGEDCHYFQRQQSLFTKYYQCIFMDSRAHGKSDVGTAPLSLTLMADDVIKTIEALNLPPVNVLGFSDGANIALLAALKQPQLFKRIILNGANIMPSGLKTSVYLSILREYVFAKGLNRQLLALMVKEPKLSFKDLTRVQCPALVIVGEHDMIKKAHTQKIAASLPDAKLAIIPKADHFCAFKQDQIFNQIVLEFLAGNLIP